MRTIDSHQHFWTLARGDYDWLTPHFGPLYRDFGPEDLNTMLDAAGIEGTIVVQAAATVAETEFLLSTAELHEWVLGVVGWVDMEAVDAPQTLIRLAQHPKLVGIRPMIHDITDGHWMLRPTLRPSVQALIELGLTFDALVRPRHLDPLLRFLDRYPGLRCLIDHAAKPQIRDGLIGRWADKTAAIAESTRAYCKFSGLATEAAGHWAPRDLRPYSEILLEHFGPSRMMFGSDWPVVTMAADYGRWVSVARQLTDGLPEQDRAQIFGGTAQRFYLG